MRDLHENWYALPPSYSGGKWRGLGLGIPLSQKNSRKSWHPKIISLKKCKFSGHLDQNCPQSYTMLWDHLHRITFNFCFCLVIPTLSSQAASFPDSCRQFWPSDDLAGRRRERMEDVNWVGRIPQCMLKTYDGKIHRSTRIYKGLPKDI